MVKMIKINRFRPEDYWLIAVSIVAIIFLSVFFYAGTMQLRIIGLALGLPGILFTTYIIRRSYSVRRSRFHLIVCIFASAGLALGIHLLTN